MAYAEAGVGGVSVEAANIISHPATLGTVPRTTRAPWGSILGFIAVVLLPVAVATCYLFWIAGDRYASRTAFSIRSNEVVAPVEILGAITQLGGSSALTDGQILYEYFGSQPMLERANSALDLETIWNRHPGDWFLALGHDHPVEDVLWHWQQMVDVYLDSASGIVEVEARAFTPEDARAIAQEILTAGGDLVNRMSEEARTDAVRHAAEELDLAKQRLREIRMRLRSFRDVEQEVDPVLNVRAALELVATLEEEHARAQVRLGSLIGVLDPARRGFGVSSAKSKCSTNASLMSAPVSAPAPKRAPKMRDPCRTSSATTRNSWSTGSSPNRPTRSR